MPVFKSHQSTTLPFLSSEPWKGMAYLRDPVTGAPVGIKSPNSSGPDGIWTPIEITAAQAAAPTDTMLADINAVYRLNTAPWTRYVSNGTALATGLDSGAFLPIAGGTLTGSLTVGAGAANALTITPGATATVATTIAPAVNGPLTILTRDAPTGNVGGILLKTGTATTGTTGSIDLTAGNSTTTPGALNFTAGDNTGTSGAGGIVVTTGTANGGGVGGPMLLQTGGSFGGNGNGGDFTISLGKGSGTGRAGTFTLKNASGGMNSLTITPGAAAANPIVLAQSGTGGIQLPTVGFNGTAPIAKPTVSGLKGSNAALASLITALVNYGLITDTTGV